MSADGTYNVSGQVVLTAAQLAEQAAQEAATGSDTGGQAEAGDQYSTLTVIRQGKNGSETCQVEVGSSIADLMSSLGWEYRNHSFKLTTDGQTGVTNTSDSGFKFGEGSHTLFVSPKVAGGC